MRALANAIILGFVVLVFLIGIASYQNSQRMTTFLAACQEKGGEALFRYGQEPRCYTPGALIPIK
jgi:hypothetical protein